MIRKKSGFLTFCFSLVPGAGEMYMGFMKQGLSIMAAFWLVIFVATFLDIGPALFILPIMWCYSFFNVNNMRGLPDEEFYTLEDDYIFHFHSIFPNGKWNKVQNNILAVLLIVIGFSMIWHYSVYYLEWLLPMDFYWSIVNDVPQCIVGLLMVLGGIYLIRGKKRELEQKPEKQGE